MKTRKEVVNPEGVTLGQLTDFVASCNAAEIPQDTLIEVRAGWRKVKSISAESEGA